MVYTYIMSTFATDKEQLKYHNYELQEHYYRCRQDIRPGLAINVKIVTNEDLGEAHFVVADIDYQERDMRIPFIIYNDGEEYMPYDWEDADLPETAVDIDHINWVSYHDDSPALIISVLSRVF